MLLPVLTYPDDRLRRTAAPVEHFDAELARFVDSMFETMTHEGGVGLAATQVNDLRRVLVMECGVRDGGEARPMAFVNPEIVAREGSLIWCEGCLSVPGSFAEVERAEAVTVEFVDVTGAPQTERFTGLEAVCMQHEIDHLDGVLFVDRLGSLERKAVLADYAGPEVADPVESAP